MPKPMNPTTKRLITIISKMDSAFTVEDLAKKVFMKRKDVIAAMSNTIKRKGIVRTIGYRKAKTRPMEVYLPSHVEGPVERNKSLVVIEG